MWFAEQINSFRNLGICKEYAYMARSKSTSGNKSDRNKEQVTSNPAALTDGATLAEAAPSKVNAEPRKFELKKVDGRANVVPINIEDEIRRRAYELYEQRGFIGGHEKDDWLLAEEEVMQRYRQQTA
jgi:hypothetical protein